MRKFTKKEDPENSKNPIKYKIGLPWSYYPNEREMSTNTERQLHHHQKLSLSSIYFTSDNDDEHMFTSTHNKWSLSLSWLLA